MCFLGGGLRMCTAVIAAVGHVGPLPTLGSPRILQDQCPGRPDINIVCEKVAYEGVTRFEDRWLTAPPSLFRPCQMSAHAAPRSPICLRGG